tara:strand:- start:13282 stop:13857 length:576 start_codon:yes stop_codon:yes gene_type:complete
MSTRITLSNLVPVDIDESASSTHRPYYTEFNALAVKPIFDSLIANNKSVFYSASQAGCSNSTLHSKLLYGIKWLCDNDANKEAYKDLKKKIFFKKVPAGIQIRFDTTKMMLANLAEVGKVVREDSANTRWMDTFTSWIGTAKELDVFDSEKILGGRVDINDEAEMALIKVCAQLGCELDCKKSDGTFIVMK